MQGLQDGTRAEPPAYTQDTHGSQLLTDQSEPMDSIAPDPGSPQQSPSNKGKRAALSPALFPDKEPLLKKQHWESQADTSPEDNRSDSFAALPASELIR